MRSFGCNIARLLADNSESNVALEDPIVVPDGGKLRLRSHGGLMEARGKLIFTRCICDVHCWKSGKEADEGYRTLV